MNNKKELSLQEPNLAYFTTTVFMKHDEISNKKAEELIHGAEELRGKISEFINHRKLLQQDLSKEDLKDVDYSDNEAICKFIDEVNKMTNSHIGENKKYRKYCLDKDDLKELIDATSLLIPQMEQNANLKVMQLEPTLLNLIYVARMAHEMLKDHNSLLATINRNSVR